MSEKKTKKQNFRLRARLPLILRVFALLGLVTVVIVIGIGFYINSGYDEFRLKPGHRQLSKDVVGIVNGYERREFENGDLKYYIKADKATTFSDEHQELETVFLQVFDEDNSEISDNISANKAIYIPSKDKSKTFTIYFAGDVDVKTRNGLKIKTEQIAYDKSTEIADSAEYIEFERENVKGTAYGAVVNIQNKTLDLLKDVEIFAYASDKNSELAKNDIKTARLKAGRAFVDQKNEKIKLENGVEIFLTPENETNGELTQPTDIKANAATAYFRNREITKFDLNGNVDVYQKPTNANKSWTRTKADQAIAEIDKELKTLELFNNVQIETTANNSNPTRIRATKANYYSDQAKFVLEKNVEIITLENSIQTRITASRAVYQRNIDVFDLENNVEITSTQDSKPTKITASNAHYEQRSGKVLLNGNAQILQGSDIVKGDVINADLYPDNSIRYAYAVGNGYLKQVNPDRTTEVKASELNATFAKDQKILNANAIGNSDVLIIPANSSEYTKFGMFAPKEINLVFRNDGTLSNLQTQGRTTLKLNSPNNSPDSADKKLTADKIKTVFRNNGNELLKAEAIGNAKLIVEPLRASSQNYKTEVDAPRFDCDFLTKNNAKNCSATGNALVVRYPTVKSKSKQMLSANKLNAIFDTKTQDIERFDANGKSKFSEADRQGIADQIIYTATDGLVRFRGGEPTVWDSQARAKASEIDWDTQSDKSMLNGNVSTTYYSQKATGGATPFGDARSPVFITSSNARFDHKDETGLYTGNARLWQGNNYVRSDKLLIQQKEGQMFAEGKVQSLIYDTTRTVDDKKSKTPVYASADKMFYERKNNFIRYENNVDIRQGNDRIVAETANIYLDDDNQLKQTIVEDNVVITQPNRRATGTYAQYNAADESVILRGNPARVVDSESGTSSGREVIVYLKENRVVGNGKTNRNGTGRVRTVYKIKDRKIN